jgi:phosphate starvation-inducible PhoH-like protein
LTPSGYRLMSDIHVGDEVIAVDGSVTEVLDVYPQGKKRIYRITLSDGSTTRATFDHLWSVREEEAEGFEVLSTGEIVLDMSEGRRYAILPLGERFGMAARFPEQAV